MSLLTNLVAYWKCDESSGNLVDQTSNNNDLTNVNTATFSAGKIYNGMSLARASSQYFNIADASQTGLDITGDFTFSFQMKLASLPAADQDSYHIIDKANEAGNQRGFTGGYWKDGTTLKLQWNLLNAGTGTWDVYYVAITLPIDTWMHIVVTWTASTHTMKFYKDAVLIGTSTGVQGYTSIFNNTAPFTIGAYYDGTNSLHHFDGMLDEIGIWTRVITYEEIYAICNEGDGRSYPLGYNAPTYNDTLAFDAFSEKAFETNTSITWAHTCSGNNRILIIGVGAPTSDTITAVTYNGVAATLLGKVFVTGNRWIYLYALIAPATGTNNIVVTSSGSQVLLGLAISYTGARQYANPTQTITSNADAATSLTATITTLVNNCWTVLMGRASLASDPINAGTATTKRGGDSVGDGIFDSNADIATPSSTSLQFTWTGATNSAGIIAAIAPTYTAPSSGFAIMFD